MAYGDISCFLSELTLCEKGTVTLMISLLLRYTETLRLDLHKLESKQKRRNKYRIDAFLN